MTTTRLSIAAICLAATLLTGGADAGPSQLDDDRMISGLADLGMTELLEHMIETEPQDDPAKALYVQYEAQRATFNNANMPIEQRFKAVEAAMQTLRKLIKQHDKHWERPVWQVNFAEMVLLTYLPGVVNNAPDFYAFGVVTARQREAMHTLAVEAHEQLSDANLTFFRLQKSLPLEPDHEEKRVNTGKWDRWMSVANVNLPFASAHAALYTALLPDDHPYFARADQNIPQKKLNDPAAEKKRLLSAAAADADQFTRHEDVGRVARPAQVIVARAAVRRNDRAAAQEALDMLQRGNERDYPDLLGKLAEAQLSLQNSKQAEAVGIVKALHDHSAAQGAANLLNRLLIVDAHHQLLMHGAKTDEAVSAAYQPYLDLINDTGIDQSLRNFLRDRIYERWGESLKDQTDLSRHPPIVLMAVAENALNEGRNLLAEYQQFMAEGNDAQATAAYDKAYPKFERSVELNEMLLKRETLPGEIKSRVMYNLGFGKYFLNPNSLKTQVEISLLWAKLADEFPNNEQAEEAIGYAVGFMQDAHTKPNHPEEIDDAYAEVCRVLFERYPDTVAADNQRLYYGYYILQQTGEYQEAVEHYEKIPSSHATYYDALREKLFCLKGIYQRHREAAQTDNTQANAREMAARKLIEEAREVREQAEAAMLAGATGSVETAAAWARLLLADIYIEQARAREAVDVLEDFTETFKDDDTLVREGLAKRIVALARTGKYAESAAEAQQMMDKFPDHAAGVISGVLDQISERIDYLRDAARHLKVTTDKEQLLEEARGLAQTAKRLADLLLKWAQDEGLHDDQMLPYQLMRVKALIVSGKAEEAVKAMEGLYKKYPNDANVVYYLAEAKYAVGTEESRKATNPLWNKIREAHERANTKLLAAEFQVESAGDDPDKLAAAQEALTKARQDKQALDPLYWMSWMRSLQITSEYGSESAKAQIPIRVDQLRIEDPRLGGDRTYRELMRLRRAHM